MQNFYADQTNKELLETNTYKVTNSGLMALLVSKVFRIPILFISQPLLHPNFSEDLGTSLLYIHSTCLHCAQPCFFLLSH